MESISKKIKEFLFYPVSIFLWILAITLVIPITIWNLIEVKLLFKTIKGYFLDTAQSIDKWGNREFRTLWNKRFITKDSTSHFGNIEETISSVLGKNELEGTLTKLGRLLVKILNFVDKNHCLNSIDDDINYYIEDFIEKYKK